MCDFCKNRCRGRQPRDDLAVYLSGQEGGPRISQASSQLRQVLLVLRFGLRAHSVLRQLEIPSKTIRSSALWVIPPAPLRDGRAEVPLGGLRGELMGASCLSLAGFGAAAPCVARS